MFCGTNELQPRFASPAHRCYFKALFVVPWFDFCCFLLSYNLQNFLYGWERNLPSKSLKVQIKIKQTSRQNSFLVIPHPSYLSLNSWDISQHMSEVGSETIIVWEKEERIKAQSQECKKKRFCLIPAVTPFCHHIPRKNNKQTKQTHKLRGFSAFEQTKQHVWSLQPGCQDIRKAEILSLENYSIFWYFSSLNTICLGRWSYEAPKPKWQQVLPKSSWWGRPGRYDGCWRVSCSSSLQHSSSHLHLQDKNWFQQGKSKLWHKILVIIKAQVEI